MIEKWHQQFNPSQFLSRVNIERLIEENKAHRENKVERLRRPCILCGANQGPGLLLNDQSCLCEACLADVSK